MEIKTLFQVIANVAELLEPLDPNDRRKVVASVMAGLGEAPSFPAAPGTVTPGATPDLGGGEEGDTSFGPKANRWITQNGLTYEMLGEVFHIKGNAVELIAQEIPGDGKRAKSQNCYLLAGVAALLATDDATFEDTKAIKLCQEMGCHDRANHAATRRSLGKVVAGNKEQGFTLPAPGLKAAAELIKQMQS